jgi:hypothetical protein
MSAPSYGGKGAITRRWWHTPIEIRGCTYLELSSSGLHRIEYGLIEKHHGARGTRGMLYFVNLLRLVLVQDLLMRKNASCFVGYLACY